MYRFDNEIIFEEKRLQDKMPVDPAAVILEKDRNFVLETLLIEYQKIIGFTTKDQWKTMKKKGNLLRQKPGILLSMSTAINQILLIKYEL